MARPPGPSPAAAHESPRAPAVLVGAAGTPLLRWLIARYAVPSGQPCRIACDNCGTLLALAGPGALALLPPGGCGRCGARVGAPGYAVELLTAIAVAVIVLATPTVALFLAGLAWVICAVPLCFIDALVHRLPDVLTYPAVGLVFTLLGVDALASGHGDKLARAALAALVYGGAALLLAVLPGRYGLGVGDAKLLVSIAALLGWWSLSAVFLAVFVAFLFASATGTIRVCGGCTTRHRPIPLGPHFVAGTLVVLAVLAAHRLVL